MTPLLMLIVILILLVLGVPIAFTLGLTAVLFIVLQSDFSLTFMTQQLYLGANSFPLLAIPLFILAGSIMNYSGISKRLINLALLIVGIFKGGLAYVNVVASVFFGAITGTAVGASAAVGQIVIPAMVDKGYRRGFSAATTSAGSSLGILLPPSVPMILYASVSGISVSALFMTGIPIGLTIAAGFMVVAYFLSAKQKGEIVEKSIKVENVGVELLKNIPALLVPVIILGSILTGVATPTESAAIAVFVGIVAALIYREMSMKDFFVAIEDSVRTTAFVMFIVACAGLLGFAFAGLGVGHQMMEPLLQFANDPIAVMLITSLILFLGGLVFDGTVMVLVIVPLFLPLADAVSVDPLQFAMVVLIVWAIGQQTPPVASGLYITTALAKATMWETSKYNVWYILVLLIVLFFMIYFPEMMLYIPNLLID
ncbi:TRAP transporter large permease [Geomicrobium sp. JCM 19039]|uniref:TRAP transporter large permease n=1 Tax=Geomicrobium sp. JCM 19039 TaxID=1460636 RepID=UPI00045F13E7|nr:TRAP transporter large permease [Geomicrobium sp. JCM 19039]GAK10674.1 TRAP-type C4-dicarboxylate transport system, large permease component [Geomicrobium sp. JCM 19039]